MPDPDLIDASFSAYEQQIIGIYSQSAEISGISQKCNIIFGYLQMFHSLTQKQLCDLTGFSQSNISSLLNSMTTFDQFVLKKNLIPGTHTFEYSLIQPEFRIQFNNNEVQARDLGYLQGKVEKFIETLKTGSYHSLPTFSFFVHRLEEIRFLLRDYHSAPILPSRLYLASIAHTTPRQNEILPGYPLTLDPPLRQLEEELISILVNSEILLDVNKPVDSKTMGYFFTRGALTQQMLKKLTKFSNGAISQAISSLVEKNMLELVPKEISQTRSQVYLMESVILKNLDYSKYFWQKLVELRSSFIPLLEEIKNLPPERQALKGYHNILEMVTNIININLRQTDKKKLSYQELIIQRTKDFLNEFGPSYDVFALADLKAVKCLD